MADEDEAGFSHGDWNILNFNYIERTTAVIFVSINIKI